MLDLHIQSSLGDGDFEYNELLKQMKNYSVDIFSITDRDNAELYEKININEYPGLIPGVSLTTYYQGHPIDILAYDVHPSIINAWYKKRYPEHRVVLIEKILSGRLKDILTKQNIIIDYSDLDYKKRGSSLKKIFKRIVVKYPDFEYTHFRNFYRQALSNPNSSFYINEAEFLPDVDEVLDLIRLAGGNSFLAHPYEYHSDIATLLEWIMAKNIDGIEAYHPSCSYRNSLKLLEFCLATNKKATLGSGFSDKDDLIPLGVNIPKEIMKLSCFRWILKRYQRK